MYIVLINARTHVATFAFPVLLQHPQWNEKILKMHSISYQSEFSKTIYLEKYFRNVEQVVIKFGHSEKTTKFRNNLPIFFEASK